MSKYGVNTNELDAARDVMLRSLETINMTLDRMPMSPELRAGLRKVLEAAHRASDDVTLAERRKILDAQNPRFSGHPRHMMGVDCPDCNH